MNSQWYSAHDPHPFPDSSGSISVSIRDIDSVWDRLLRKRAVTGITCERCGGDKRLSTCVVVTH